MKILIAVPTYENIMPDTYKSIYDLDKGGHQTVFNFVRGYDCAAARNNIAQMALDIEADYVLMVDNDVVLQSDTLINLLEGGYDVCLGYCALRNAENIYSGKANVYRMGEDNYTMQYPGQELVSMAERGVHKIQVHGGGMACALIKTDVFRKLEFPWFSWVTYPNREVLSEDLYFCEQCNSAGSPIYVDTRATCGHLLRHVQWIV